MVLTRVEAMEASKYRELTSRSASLGELLPNIPPVSIWNDAGQKQHPPEKVRARPAVADLNLGPIRPTYQHH